MYLARVNEDSRPAGPDEIGVGALQLHRARVSAQDPDDSMRDIFDVTQKGQMSFLAGKVFLPEGLLKGNPESHCEVLVSPCRVGLTSVMTSPFRDPASM